MQIFVCVSKLLCPAMGSEATKPKNCFNVEIGKTKMLQQAARIMKLTALLLLGASLHLHAVGFGQKISLSETNVPIESVFKKIEQQTNLKFLYADHVIKDARNVTIKVKNANLGEVLNLVFTDQVFGYEVKENTVFVLPGKKISNMDAKVSKAHSRALIDVSGKVTDENGSPLQGANVVEKGKQHGTITNADGVFVLKEVDGNGRLEISYVGYQTVTVSINNRTSIVVAIKQSDANLQEVVINKGYYTEKRMLATGNVATVKSTDIAKQPVQNPLLALVGRVAGLQVQQQTGFANSGVVVRVQGTNSLGAGLDPLYVIDGVPYGNMQIPGSQTGFLLLGNSGTSVAGNPLSLINPNDIERIDVLKDADATSIYGSRGANGVILITTKKGKAGKTKIDANVRTGWGQIGNKVALLNTEQYLAMRREGYANDGIPVPDKNTAPTENNYDLTVWDENRYTDWQDELIGEKAKYTDAQLTFSGGTSNTQFLLGAGYHKETTVFRGDFSDQKTSVQFNINHTGNQQKFKLQLSGIYVNDNNQLPARDITVDALRLAPNAPRLLNEDGSMNWEPITSGTGSVSTWTNPLSYFKNLYNVKSSNLISSALLSYQILPGLSFSSNFGYNSLQIKETSINPLTAQRPERIAVSSRVGGYGDGNSYSWIIEPQANYFQSFGKGKLEALAGSTFQQSEMTRQELAGLGYSSDLLIKDIKSAASVLAITSTNNVFKYNAIFGRINYNWDNKYVVNLTARRDGSSRFGTKNLFANFYAVAGSWIFTNERIFSNKRFLSFGKLRGSFGTSGNDQIGEYGFMNLFNSVVTSIPYQGITALAPDKHANPYLQWEKTKKLQFGIDLGFLSDRMQLNVNYFLNRSSNLLVLSALSSNTGFTNVRENFNGIVQNAGWELTLNTANVEAKDFTWTTSINFTIPVDNGKLKEFPNLDQSIYAATYVVGKSILDVRRFHSLGVDPATGRYIFENVNGNPTFAPSANDRTSFVNVSQRLYGGMQNVLRYKDFQLDFTFQFVKRSAPLFFNNYNQGWFSGLGNQGNHPAIVLDRWQKPGDAAVFHRYTSNRSGEIRTSFESFGGSDGSIVEASYLKMTNMSFSWNVPQKWKKSIKLQNASLFLQGQNLFTIDKYKGLDASTGATGLPPIRVVTVGAQISF